jgi:hypothetical protein
LPQITGGKHETKNHGNGIVEIADDNALMKNIDDVFSQRE